jgi:hypothetical protein
MVHLNKIIKSIFLCLSLLGLVIISVDAQKTEAETEFKYLKNTDNSRTLTYSVKYKKENGDLVPAEGINIIFTSGANEDKAYVKTSSKGIAKYIIPSSKVLKYQDDGKLKFVASIEVNKLIETKSDEISVKDIEIEMNCKMEDTIRKVYFKAFELGPDGEKKPIPKTDINFYVPRMFSLLKVAEGSFGDDGTGEIEFPSGIAGDSLGNITIIGRIEENADYLNAEKQQVIAWGIPTSHRIPKFQRALWTAVAPTWMIVTLTILLLGVWGHYMFVIYKLWKIKQESRRDA